MKIERIQPIPLEKDVAKQYARQITLEKIGQSALNVKYLGGGSFGMAFSVEFADSEPIVVKFLRAKDMLEKEVFDLKLLGNHSPVKFPKVIFERKADDIIPLDCYAMEKVDGSSAFMSYLSRLLMR